MPPKVFLEGRVQDLGEARVPVTDHGFLFGDSIFETLRALEGRCAFVATHLARLRRSAQACRLGVPWSDAELGDALHEVLAASGESDAAMRLVVTRGSGPLEADPTRCTEPRLVIFARARTPIAPEHLENGAPLIVARGSVSAPGPHAKTGNYLASVLALAQAREKGAFEALILNTAGRVTECAGSNVFAVIEGSVVTPHVDEGLLEGIARANVLDLCAEAGLPVDVRELELEELVSADEAFLTSTLKEVVPIASIDGVPLREHPGAVTSQLMRAYRSRLVAEVTR